MGSLNIKRSRRTKTILRKISRRIRCHVGSVELNILLVAMYSLMEIEENVRLVLFYAVISVLHVDYRVIIYSFLLVHWQRNIELLYRAEERHHVDLTVQFDLNLHVIIRGLIVLGTGSFICNLVVIILLTKFKCETLFISLLLNTRFWWHALYLTFLHTMTAYFIIRNFNINFDTTSLRAVFSWHH